jgi:putative FmdB family regulatory protein
MPTYEYACKSCSEHVEVVQSFKDDPLTTCPACGGPLRKVFGAIGISFKGSGFYKTDSRPKEKSDKAAASSSSSSSDKAAASSDKSASASGSSSGSSDKPGAAPASTGSESSKADTKAAAS